MSIFKTKWIILKIDKLKPQEFLYTIFTKDYWKIKCNKKLSKKEKTLDLWYLINFEISTKQNSNIHNTRNIKISSEYDLSNKTFKEMNLYLEILANILKQTPEWNPIYELFELLELLNSYNNIDELKLLLIKLKVTSIFWELWDDHSDPTISKILKFIHNNKTDRILKLTGIDDKIKIKLEKL